MQRKKSRKIKRKEVREVKKGTIELNVKINMNSISTMDKKEQMKNILEEIEGIREEHPDIKIYVEVNR